MSVPPSQGWPFSTYSGEENGRTSRYFQRRYEGAFSKRRRVPGVADLRRWAKDKHVKYRHTNTEVKLGDRVLYHHLFFGKAHGVVAYLPGMSKPNHRIIPHQWVVRLSNGKGVFMVHGDDIEFAHRRVEFLERGENDSEIAPAEDV